MLEDVEHIESANELLCYAAGAQVQQMMTLNNLRQHQVGAYMGKSPPEFSKLLRNKGGDLTPRFMRDFDNVAVVLAQDLDQTGGLSALGVRLARKGTLEALTVTTPSRWRRQMLQRGLNGRVTELDILTLAAVLLAKLQAVPDQAAAVCDRNRDTLNVIVERLIQMAAAPPTPDNMEALITLGSIAGSPPAFEAIRPRLELALQNHPLGFRLWRAVTAIVRINEGGDGDRFYRQWVETQLGQAQDRRPDSLFPARSLDIELAIAAPLSWSGGDDRHHDVVDRVLRRRIADREATVRERGTAAFGLWDRALRCESVARRAEAESFLREVATAFIVEAEERRDVALGLRWVAATLAYCLDTGHAVIQRWPEGGLADEPCVRVVRDSLAGLDTLPTTELRTATMTLVEHALLQNAGVHRRNAVDALMTGGYTRPVVDVFGRVLSHPDSEVWLRCRALFATSFLQNREPDTANILSAACRQAKEQLVTNLPAAVEGRARGAVSEMHAALFAVGDLFGAAGAEEDARAFRGRRGGDADRSFDDELEELLDISRSGPPVFPVGRGAAYLIAVTARHDDRSAELLGRIAKSHPDGATRRLASWGGNRILANRVRPIHDSPYNSPRRPPG